MRRVVLFLVALVVFMLAVPVAAGVITYLERGDDGVFRPVVVRNGKKTVIDQAAISGPALNREGSRIAFTLDDPSLGSYALAVIDSSGGNVEIVGDGSWGELDPSWSPDGQRLVMSWYPTVVMHQTAVGVLNLETGEVHSVPGTEGGSRPDWSPSGEWILFEREGAVWATRRDGSDERMIATNGRDPTWGPAPNQITFIQGSDLVRTSLMGEPGIVVRSFEGSLESPTCRPEGCSVLTYSGVGWDGRDNARAWFLPTHGKAGIRAHLGRSAGLDAAGKPGLLDYFVDDNGIVHEDAINRIALEGISVGCDPPENIRFCPGDAVTRGEMAAFLVRALDLTRSDDAGFEDSAESVFKRDIGAIAAAGVTYGCNPPQNDLYCPRKELTRGEMAAFLVRALELPPGEPDHFVDDDQSVFAADIDALASAGITVGCNPPENTLFCPDRSIARGEMATFLVRGVLER
ncbi:MAG: hypothetical protein GEU79_05350 [Acidimicrobiia bacterium]|nr:hypothetical protein [Acidimicrobiia bacterium]